MNEMIRRNDNITIIDEYKPTPAEIRILETWLNPEYAGKSVTAKCQIADCTTQTYYTALKKPEFMALMRNSAIDLVKDKLLDVVTATVKYAVSSAQNHQDRRILLEMAGLYREKQDINLSADDALKAKIAVMSDSEIKEQIQKFIENNPEIALKNRENDS